MKKLLNSLYITRQESYLHKERDTLVIEHRRKKLLQLPAHSVGDIHCFGQVMVSPPLMGYCGEQGIGLSFFSEQGRFLARVQGRQSGNVLLRRQQYREADRDPLAVAKPIIAAKLANSRQVLLRQQRNHGESQTLTEAARHIAQLLKQVQHCDDINRLRGLEGDGAASYFGVFSELIRPQVREQFPFRGRNRRPPKDAVNALLSFLYSLLTQEISSALQGVGLDAYVGFLHVDRPGRASLALDVLEEFRASWADRLALSLINRQQLRGIDFVVEASGAVRLTDDARKTVLTAYQARKQDEIRHPFLNEQVSFGLLPHVQALLLARHLRGDLACYPPFSQR
jgi:CRISPR-associated protein Cas1